MNQTTGTATDEPVGGDQEATPSVSTSSSDLIDLIAAETSKAIDAKYLDRGVCILATAVFVRACDYFDIPAVAVPVRTAVFNPVATEWVLAGRDIDEDNGRPCRDAGGYVVQIDSTTHHDNRYPGHLVAQVDSLLVDVDFRQFSRPDHDINLRPYAVFDLSDHAWPDESFMVPVDGSTVVYEYLPDAPDWRKAPDWSDRKAKPLAGQVIRAVKASAEQVACS